MSARIIAALLCVLAVGPLCAQQPDRAEAEFARVQKLLDATSIDVSDLKDEMPLGKFLAAVEKRLPKDKKLSLTIDKVALGKDYDAVVKAPVRIALRQTSIRQVLNKALRQAPVEVGYAVRDGGVVVTRARLTTQKMTYRIDDLVARLPALLPVLGRGGDLAMFPERLRRGVAPDDGETLLARLLDTISLKPYESLELLNGSKLVVVAAPDTHDLIESIIRAVRSMDDLAVVMNARLYEIDVALYVRVVAPLLAKDKDGNRPAVVPLDQRTFAALVKQKVLAESDLVKLRPNEDAAFLSKQSVFRYVASADKDDVRSGLSGVSFRVRPRVSTDRRFLRLVVSQRVNQLVKIDKARKPDLESGKTVEIAAPSVRRSSLAGTVDLPDGGGLLMPVEYQPEADRKAWVLLARPIIWIEEEMKEMRRQGAPPFSPADQWRSEVVKEEADAPVVPKKRLPADEKTSEILQAVIDHVLTSPSLADVRKLHGTPKEKTFSLIEDENLGWPEKFAARAPGYRLVTGGSGAFENRRLGIRLRRFDLTAKEDSLEDAPVAVRVFNAGGYENGAVLESSDVYYRPVRVGKRWAVECLGVIDK